MFHSHPVQQLKQRLDLRLQNIFCPDHITGDEPNLLALADEISDAHNHPLRAGGKRVRPLLLQIMAGACGGSEAIRRSENSAIALELIHTYSLVHDDLPCMDNDDFRRGLPTTHKLYGESKGLLVGDGLLTQAFLILASPVDSRDFQLCLPFENNILIPLQADLTQTLAEASGWKGMVLGQWLDISFSSGSPTQTLHWEQLVSVHVNKTGRLLGCALEMGLMCAVAQSSFSEPHDLIHSWRAQARKIGLQIGLAFQIIDDILDSTQPSEQLGKTAGKDEAQNKMTAVSVLGLEKAKEYASKITKEAKDNLESLLNRMAPFYGISEDWKKLLLSCVSELLERSN